MGVVGVAAIALFFIVPATAGDTRAANTTITADPCIIEEQFSASVLDPAWTFIQRPGRGMYSLSDSPGSFRFYGEGSRTGQALSWWDPTWSHSWPESSYLIRPFVGDRWVLRAKVTYGLHGISNGNSMGAQDPHVAIVFGDGQGPKLDFQRCVDYWYNRDVLNIHLQNAEGGDPVVFPDDESPNIPIDFRSPDDAYHYTGGEGWINHTYWYEVVRDGRQVTIGLSTDGTNYQPARSFALPPTTGATQRIALYLSEWAPVGSHVDLDMVTVRALADSDPTPTSTPTPTPTETVTPTVTTPRPTPTPLPEGIVPGRFEAEGFDLGGEGVGYHDTTPGNSGGAVCRTAEDVDIAALPGGGYAVTGIEDGEWLAFAIDRVANTGDNSYPYPVELYLTSDRDGRSVEVEVDGNIVRNVSVPNTGSLQNFAPVLTQFRLTPWGQPEQGRHTLRLLFHGDGQAIDKVIIWENRPRGWADGWAWPGFTANQTRGQAPLTVQFTDRSSPYTYGWRWSFNDGAYSSVQNPVHTYLNPGVYTVSLQVQEEDHWSGSNGMFMWFHHLWESKTATMQVTVERPVIAVQSGSTIPLDGDGDGLYEDVNGNGKKDFADIVLLFTQLSWVAANEPASVFDYNGNTRIDFADVVWLFSHL